MKTQTLINKLTEKGFVLPTALQWTHEDIDLRMNAIGLGNELRTMSRLDKQHILESFFDEYADDIIEFINQLLENHLSDMADYQPMEKEF